MDLTLNNSNQADSAAVQPVAAPAINTTQLRAIDFGAVDAFRIDSSRIAKKPAAPIIKTVPYVPENDTVNHPTYDVLTGDFVISYDNSIESQLHINPITPAADNQKTGIVAEQQIKSVVEVRQSFETEVDTVAETEAEPIRQQNVLVEAEASRQADTNIATPADTTLLATGTAAADTTIAASNKVVSKIFEEKEGKPITRKISNFSVDRTVSDTDWMIGIVIVSFVLFIWVRMIYGKFIKMVLQTAVSAYTAHRIYDEANAVRGRGFFLLNVIFYINASLFACQTLDFYSIKVHEYNGFMHFALSVAFIIGYFTLRTIILKILDFIFDTKAFGEYNFTIYIYNKVYGLVMMPVVAIIPFVPGYVTEKLVWAGLALYALTYLLTLFRGLQICIKNRISIFYLFFYLCALEILPIAVVVKIVIDYCL